MCFNNEEFSEAVKFFKLFRIHIVECGIDYYDKLDDKGVMYYVYPLIARAYEHLEEFQKAKEYWEKAFKEGIPDAIIVRSYELMIMKKFDEVYECLKELVDNNMPLAIFALMDWYLDSNNPKRDENRAHEYEKELRKLGYHQL